MQEGGNKDEFLQYINLNKSKLFLCESCFSLKNSFHFFSLTPIQIPCQEVFFHLNFSTALLFAIVYKKFPKCSCLLLFHNQVDVSFFCVPIRLPLTNVIYVRCSGRMLEIFMRYQICLYHLYLFLLLEDVHLNHPKNTKESPARILDTKG